MTIGERVVALKAEGKSDREIGAIVGLHMESVRRLRNKIARGTPAAEARPASELAPQIVQTADDEDHATLESPQSGSIQTLDDLLAAAKVDLSVWAVEKHLVNAWTLGGGGQAFQVKAWLAKIAGAETARQIMADALEDLKAHSRHVPATRPSLGTDGHLFELTLPDLHLGKYAWAPETGEDYDVKIAVARAKAAVSDLIAQVQPYPIERVLFLFGNDYLHYDNLVGTTTAGTPQDRDSRYHKMVRTGRQLAVWIIDQLAEIAPVHVMVVPGNHDRQSTWNLGEILDAWYRHDARVSFDNEPRPFKYHRYGTTLLGFTHGDETPIANLPQIMPTNVPEMWARSRFREWHIGHRHISEVKTMTTPVKSTNGVRVRTLQSLSGIDAWHAKSGYFGEPGAAEGFIWHKERGQRANLTSNRFDIAEAA